MRVSAKKQKKQKFFKPAINIKKSRELYVSAATEYNKRFYDENGKFKRKDSKKLYLQHKEIFMALVVIMNDRLKIRNFSIGDNPKEHNFTRNPFAFYVNTQDILNVLTQKTPEERKKDKELKRKAIKEDTEYFDDKKEISKTTIKRALYRFASGDLAYILEMNYKRSKYRYEIVLSPILIHFQETFTKNITSSKLKLSKTKSTKCTIITSILNTTTINNKTTNHKKNDFSKKLNLQANSNFKITNYEKNKPADDYTNLLDNIISSGKLDKIKDNRKISEKRKEKKEISGEILNDLKKTGVSETIEEAEKTINKLLLPAKKVNKITSDAEKRKIEDFLYFKKRIIVNFYIYFLTILFDPKKASLYNPNDTLSPNFIYTIQSIQELIKNPAYFGNCKTIYDYEKRLKFLKSVVLNTKNNWMNKRIDFKMQYVYPNLFLNGTYTRLKFEKSVQHYEEKAKKLIEYRKKYKPAEKKITDKQFQATINAVHKILVQRDEIPTDPTFQKYVKVYITKEGNIGIRAKKNYATFKFMQFFIKNTIKK